MFHVARRKLERKVKEISQSTFGITYTGTICNVALENAGVDFDIGAIDKHSSALEVACPPPGIGAKKVQESSADHHSRTYRVSAVALENAGVDLDIS
jgi:hypothetical protein